MSHPFTEIDKNSNSSKNTNGGGTYLRNWESKKGTCEVVINGKRCPNKAKRGREAHGVDMCRSHYDRRREILPLLDIPAADKKADLGTDHYQQGYEAGLRAARKESEVRIIEGYYRLESMLRYKGFFGPEAYITDAQLDQFRSFFNKVFSAKVPKFNLKFKRVNK